MKRKHLIDIVCALFILLWSYAAISKLAAFRTFEIQLSKSPFITDISGIISWSIPSIELGITLLLLIPVTKLIGLYLSYFLMLLFSGYIYLMLNYSYYIPCSCGGLLSTMSWNQHLVFNVLLTLFSLTAIVMYKKADHAKVIK